jgi:hypothetical protein
MTTPSADPTPDITGQTIRFRIGTLGTIAVAILSSGVTLGVGIWILRGDVVMREQLDSAIASVSAQDAKALAAHAAVVDMALRPVIETLKDTSSLLGDLREEVAELRGEIRGRSGSQSSSRSP